MKSRTSVSAVIGLMDILPKGLVGLLERLVQSVLIVALFMAVRPSTRSK